MKQLAIRLYHRRMTLRGIAKLLSVSSPMVLAWIRKLGPEAIEKPFPEKVEAIQPDEIWHFLATRAHTKNGKIWAQWFFGLTLDSHSKPVLDWAIGSRGSATLKPL